MLYRKELCDLRDKETYRLFLEIFFECEKPLHPMTEYLYYKEFGPPEKAQEAEKTLATLSKNLENLENNLDELLKNIPAEADRVRIPFPFPKNMLGTYFEAVRK